MKRTAKLIAALLLPATMLAGSIGTIGHKSPMLRVSEKKLYVDIEFLLDSLRMPGNRQLFVTPVIEDGKGNRAELPTLLVNGRNMHYVYNRPGQKPEWFARYTIGQEVRRHNGKQQTVDYHSVTPLSMWMMAPEAQIVITTDTCGCGKEFGSATGPLTPLGLTPKMTPVYITPAVTPLPVSIHEGRARVQFEVDRTVLHDQPYTCRNGQKIDNREQLKVIDDSVTYALSDPNVEIAAINVTGYASPESPYTHNDYLATNRSKALAEYLASRYHLPAEAANYDAVPENWGEFRQQVLDAKDITEQQREALLRLIDRPTFGPADFDAKERELKTSPEFATLYRTKILPEWFPRLRATAFAIHTRLKPLSDEKLAEVIKTNPQLMSLNQMFRVARLYPEGSPEFNEVIAIALRYYPDDPTANLNAAVADISSDKYTEAAKLLEKAGDSPEANNARGIIAVHEGDFNAAKEYFKAAGNLKEAVSNLREIDSF